MEPENISIPESKWNGYVAHRYDYDGTYLYYTMNCTGAHSYIVDMGYSCDCGDLLGGRVLRYSFDEKGRIASCEDITPMEYALKTERGTYAPGTVLTYGFGGISSCPKEPGTIGIKHALPAKRGIWFIFREIMALPGR